MSVWNKKNIVYYDSVGSKSDTKYINDPDWIEVDPNIVGKVPFIHFKEENGIAVEMSQEEKDKLLRAK